MNLGESLFERLLSDVEQEIAQAGRAAELLTGGNALNQRLPLFDGRQFFRVAHGRIFCKCSHSRESRYGSKSTP